MNAARPVPAEFTDPMFGAHPRFVEDGFALCWRWPGTGHWANCSCRKPRAERVSMEHTRLAQSRRTP